MKPWSQRGTPKARAGARFAPGSDVETRDGSWVTRPVSSAVNGRRRRAETGGEEGSGGERAWAQCSSSPQKALSSQTLPGAHSEMASEPDVKK